MRTINLKYIDKRSLKKFISKQNIKGCNNILIQIFTGIVDEKFILNLISELSYFLPQAKIIGSTSDGIIKDDKVLQFETLISFSIFKTTKIKTYFSQNCDSSYMLGKSLSSQFSIKNKIKVAICFSDGLNTNGEEFLKGIERFDENLLIAGGMAGDNGNFEKTFVFSNQGITSNGAVCATLFGDDLVANSDFSFGWKAIGKYLTVTKSEKNRVYTIDNIPAIDIYKKYLGDDIANRLPSTGVEFPFIIRKGDMYIARAVVAKYDDGSLSFAGNIPIHTKIQFGYGNMEEILNERKKKYK